jgi:hypothetical protein
LFVEKVVPADAPPQVSKPSFCLDEWLTGDVASLAPASHLGEQGIDRAQLGFDPGFPVLR